MKKHRVIGRNVITIHCEFIVVGVITVLEFSDLMINPISIVVSFMGKFIVKLEELNISCNLLSVYLNVFFK